MEENKTPKILLAEDDPINLKLMSRLLSKNGFEFITANNGESVVELAKTNPDIEVVLMDIQMPVYNGYEATQMIREWEQENGNTNRLKIIALTAHTFEEEKRKCLDAGMDDFVTKPINIQELIVKINAKPAINNSSDDVQTDGLSPESDSDK